MLENYTGGWKGRDIIAEVQRERGVTRGQAEGWLRKNVPTEKYFQKKIMEALKKEYPKAYIVKIAQGAYSQGGLPDLLFILDGHYFGFEVKRPVFGKVSKLQEAAIRKINAAGGTAAVVTYPEEAVGTIKRWFGEANVIL